LDKVQEPPIENIQALILPHAGYRYSGQTAAYGIKQIIGKKFRRVVVMGPSHRSAMENMASVPDVTHYGTPLGEVPLDTAFITALKKHPFFQTLPYVHEGEHSVQIEVPLLQRALGEFSLVPIVVGQADLASSRKMASVLASLIDEETLVVASSDFTHFGPNYGYVPFRDDVPARLKALDMGAYEHIEKKDPEGLYNYLDTTGDTICGSRPIAILLSMLPAESQAHLLKYDTSGNVTGDYTNSVSYFAIAFAGTWKKGAGPAIPEEKTVLEAEDKKRLLGLARKTIEFALTQQRMPSLEELGIENAPALEAVQGAFVTLKEHEQLRGCIGDIFPTRPLYKAVMANAINAAVNDPRFPPVQPEEIPQLHIEISVLTPLQPLDDYRRIEIGKHGVVLSKNGRRAVFLPQVAPEQGWDLEEMLTNLARKAGLPGDAWKEGASFEVFEAIVFEEDRA